jgi:hypothetical protein
LQQQQQQQPGQQPEPQDQPASHAQQQAQQQQRLGAGLCLDLSQCSIGAEGVQALAGVPGLTQLSLFGCRLGSASGVNVLLCTHACVRVRVHDACMWLCTTHRLVRTAHPCTHT